MERVAAKPLKKRNRRVTSMDIYQFRQYFYLHVDKTMFIKAILEDKADKLLIYSPYKSTNSKHICMLKKFVGIEGRYRNRIALRRNVNGYLMSDQPTSYNMEYFMGKKMFTIEQNGRKIFDDGIFAHHFGRYPTLYINFECFDMHRPGEFLNYLCYAVRSAFERHEYLRDSRIWTKYSKSKFEKYVRSETLTEEEIIHSLVFLSEILCAHFKEDKKVYVFIDEYDAPIRHFLYNNALPNDDFVRLVSVFNAMISGLLENNMNIAKALLHGRYHIEGIPLPNNIKLCRFFEDERYREFYGLTGDEMEYIYNKVGIPEELDILKERWLKDNNIKLNNRTIDIYNPLWIRLLEPPHPEHYSSPMYYNHNIYTQLQCYVGYNKVIPKILHLLSHNSITINFKKTVEIDDVKTLRKFLTCDSTSANELGDVESDLLIQILYESGWLIRRCLIGSLLTLEIPNEKIHLMIRQELRKARELNNRLNIYKFNESFRCLVENKNEETFFQIAKNIRFLVVTNKLPENEFEFHAKLYRCLKKKFVNTRGECFTMCNGQSKCTIVTVIDNMIGVVMELNIHDEENSEDALDQIVDKEYYEILNDEKYEEQIYLGIHLNKTDKIISITYLVNSIDKKLANTVIALIK